VTKKRETAQFDDLALIPEPYRGMIRTIEPDDIYLVHTASSGEPIRVRRIAATETASRAHDIEASFRGASPGLTTNVVRYKGRNLRTLILELAKAQDHFIGPAVQANPYEAGG
jgi:hypothetical protein